MLRLILTFDFPIAISILPKLGSLPAKAVFTNGEFAIEKQIFLASISCLHFSTLIITNFEAPSPSAATLLAKFFKTVFSDLSKSHSTIYTHAPVGKKGIEFNAHRIFDPNETQLGSPLNRDQYNRDFRNMLITNTALRDYELGREAKRNMAAAKQYFEMAGAAQETAARRRLMEDQFSPTKISQQRLRAQTGEAALMQAIANQTAAAAQAGTIGTSRRYGR